MPQLPSPGRHYAHSSLPAVSDPVGVDLTDDQRETLLALYGEVCTTWRALLDVRFKLLGLVPFVTVGVLVVVLPDTATANAWTAGGVCVLGLLVTLGLWIYDTRNSELYDDLVSRGRRVEAELGVQTGLFRGRPTPSRRWATHGVATTLIYLAAAIGWGYALALTVL